MSQVLVTGANGFVGRALCDAMEKHGHRVVRVVRGPATANQIAVGDIGPESEWRLALQGSDVVVHLAARVHVMRDAATNPLEAFQAVNTAGTLNLARQASQSGVRRFVYLSSVKVNGEESGSGAYRESSPANPQDPYAISKWEAEQGLHKIAAQTGLEVVILRPPLVYGPGVKANFYRLMKWVDKGLPLPFASIDNRRSMIYLGNLVDALIACVEHSAAAGKTYLVSDGEDISTAGLIRLIAQAMGGPGRLWPCPDALLRAFAKLVGKSAEADRLLGSLQVDSSRIREDLNWRPPYSVQQGITETVKWFRQR